MLQLMTEINKTKVKYRGRESDLGQIEVTVVGWLLVDVC